MGWAHSLDLRERGVSAFDAGEMTDEQVAEVFQVGEATVHSMEAPQAGDPLVWDNYT